MVATARTTQWQIAISVLDADQNVLSGPHALDPALFAIQIDSPGLNTEGPNGWLPWTGSLTLLDAEALTLSIDSRDTAATPTGAALLAQGNAVDLRIFHGGSYQRAWPTLYIISEPSPLDQPLEATVRVELGDITRLDDDAQDSLDERGKKVKRRGVTPEGNLSGMALGTLTNRHTIANNILTARGLPTSADTITRYPLSVPPQKFGTNAWGNEIGKLAGTAGYFFWIDKDDNARFTQIDLDKSAPDFSLTIGIDEVDLDGWKRANLSERPPAKLTVTGTGGRAIARDNPEVITDIRPERETTYTRTISALTNRVTEVTEERLSERLILPRIPTQGSSGGESAITGYTENTSTSLRLARRQTIVSDYSAFTKELRARQVTIEVARAMAGGDAFRDTDSLGNAYDLLAVERTTITCDYRDGQLSDRETRTQRPWAIIPWANIRPNNYAANRFLVQTNLTKEESWRKRLLVGQDWKYEFETRVPQGELKSYFGADINADVLRDDPDRSGTIESNEDGAARPPATEYMPLLYEQDNQQYSGSVEITPLAGQAHKNRERTVAIQGPYVISNSQCEYLASIVGRLDHGLSLGQQFVGAIPVWLSSSFIPGARVDITDSGLVKSYFLNGFSIAADGTETLWGCSLAELGTVGASPEDVTPPVSLAYPVVYSVTAPSPAFAANVNVALNARHTATGPSPIFSASVFETEEVEHAVTAPSPVFSARIAPPSIAVTHAVTAPSPAFASSITDLDPEAAAYIAALNGTYSQAQLDAIAQFFTDLKSDTTWASLDEVLILKGQAQADALISLKTATSVAMLSGTPGFVAGTGLTLGQQQNAYMNSGYNPSTAGNSWAQNSTTVFWETVAGTNDNNVTAEIGGRSGSGQPAVFIKTNDSAAGTFTINNDDTIPLQNISGSATVGVHLVQRTASNLTTLYLNGASVGTQNNASDGLTNAEQWLGGFNNGGSLSFQPNDRTYSIIAFGNSTVNVATITNAWNTLKAVL